MKNVRMKTIVWWMAFFSIVAVIVLLPTQGICGKKIVLKATSTWSKTYHQSVSLLHFMQLVNRKGKGEIKIQWAGGPELIKAKDQLDALSRGVIDIMNGSPDYFIGLVPAGAIMEISVPPATLTFNNEFQVFHKLYPLLDKIYQKKANAKLLGYGGPFLPFYIWTAKKKISKLSDLKGITIRTFGGATDVFVSALGASPVRISSGEVYLALKTGTVDGALRSALSLKSANEWEVLKYGLNLTSIRGGNFHWINLDKWNSLPTHIQNLLLECQRETEKWMSDEFAPRLQKEALDFVHKKGVIITKLPKGEERDSFKIIRKKMIDWYLKKVGKKEGELLLKSVGLM